MTAKQGYESVGQVYKTWSTCSFNPANSRLTAGKLEMIVLNCRPNLIVFSGAQTYMTANIAHMVLCTVVVYLSLPEFGVGLDNHAVLGFTLYLMIYYVN